MTYTKATKHDINNIAEFIAEMNIQKTHHIGFCGTDKDEILNYLQEEFEEMRAEDCFVIATEENKLIAVLGYEPDFERGLAELWGPFIKNSDWVNTAQELWQSLIESFPKEIKSVSIFPDELNQNYSKFADTIGFKNKKKHCILKCKKDGWKYCERTALPEINNIFSNSFTELHDKLFPGTYYSGANILDRLDEKSKVFFISENHDLSGYIYVESEEEFGDGYIHFIGVKESERGKGIGKHLLKSGVNWLFTSENINALELCVDSSNSAALKLYESVGFVITNRLFSAKKVGV